MIGTRGPGRRRSRQLYKGALSYEVPQGSEGPLIATPYGGGGLSKQAEITKIVAIAQLLPPGDPRLEELIEQGMEAARPCRWFGIGPKRFSLLAGLDCWTSLIPEKTRN